MIQRMLAIWSLRSHSALAPKCTALWCSVYFLDHFSQALLPRLWRFTFHSSFAAISELRQVHWYPHMYLCRCSSGRCRTSESFVHSLHRPSEQNHLNMVHRYSKHGQASTFHQSHLSLNRPQRFPTTYFLHSPGCSQGDLYLECFSLQNVVTTSSFQDHVSVDFLQTAQMITKPGDDNEVYWVPTVHHTAQRSSCKWPHWVCKTRSQPKETQMGLIPKFTGLLPGDPITVSQSCREGWSADFYFKEQTIICQLAVGLGASQVALMVKNPPANAGDIRDVVWPLGQEDPLEEGMAAHSSTRAWRIPWTEDPGGLQSIASQSWTQLQWVSMHTWPLNPFLLIYFRQTWASGPWERAFPKQHGDTIHSYNWGGYSERRKKKTHKPFFSIETARVADMSKL